MSDQRCPDEKPYKCPPYTMCYSYDEYCDSETNTVESCFPPTAKNHLDWCRRFVQGLETAINPQCQFVCEKTFNTSQLFPEEVLVEEQDSMDTKDLVIVVLSCLLFIFISLHIVRCVYSCRRRRKKAGYAALNTELNTVSVDPPEIPVTEQGGPGGKENLQVIVGDDKDDRDKETVEGHEGTGNDKRNVSDAPAPGDVSLVASRLSSEHQRLVEANSMTSRETQPVANRPASGSQEVLTDQNELGTTLRQSAENIDGNASRRSPDGSPQFSERSQSFSSSRSAGSHSSGASRVAQASGGQNEHPAETENRQKRAWHSNESNEHPIDDKDKHKVVPNGAPYTRNE